MAVSLGSSFFVTRVPRAVSCSLAVQAYHNYLSLSICISLSIPIFYLSLSLSLSISILYLFPSLLAMKPSQSELVLHLRHRRMSLGSAQDERQCVHAAPMPSSTAGKLMLPAVLVCARFHLRIGQAASPNKEDTLPAYSGTLPPVFTVCRDTLLPRTRRPAAGGYRGAVLARFQNQMFLLVQAHIHQHNDPDH